MTDPDRAVRRLIYTHFGLTGRALSRGELAAELERTEAWIDDCLARLAAEHAVVLGPDGEIAKALPFCAETTPFVVRAGGVTYHGNCAWDAFGLSALLGPSSEIELACGDCDEPLELDTEALVHVAVPATAWWDDIVFT